MLTFREMPTTMRALVIDKTGDADELYLTQVLTPTAIFDEVIVRVIAASVNPVDAKMRAGKGDSRLGFQRRGRHVALPGVSFAAR
jgi:NADPH:quinone reductase-like Zn-dependent oxidoreductase